jgi:hypothetical protein
MVTPTPFDQHWPEGLDAWQVEENNLKHITGAFFPVGSVAARRKFMKRQVYGGQ